VGVAALYCTWAHNQDRRIIWHIDNKDYATQELQWRVTQYSHPHRHWVYIKGYGSKFESKCKEVDDVESAWSNSDPCINPRPSEPIKKV